MRPVSWALILLPALALLATGGRARAALTITKTQNTVWDPLNMGLFPKAVPGARISYTLIVANGLGQSTARNVTISDAIPAKVKFYVGTGNPVTVTIGALSSLTYTYTSLGSTTDGLEFSNNNGTTWTYVPTAGADGSDPNVTNIRVTTGGSQLASDSFTITFQAIVR